MIIAKYKTLKSKRQVRINQVQESLNTFRHSTLQHKHKNQTGKHKQRSNTVNQAVDCQWARTVTLQHVNTYPQSRAFTLYVSFVQWLHFQRLREPQHASVAFNFRILPSCNDSCGELKYERRKLVLKISNSVCKEGVIVSL
jgi:hypothetical protein